MAASEKRKVHVEFDASDSGSEGDSEASFEDNDIDDEEITQPGELIDNEDDQDDSSSGKKGLADVLAKILHKKVPNHQQVILAKGKTDKEILKRKLEKESEGDGKSPKLSESALARAEKIKVWENMCRSKPDPLKREKERKLARIATRGVVQLFNAVKKQQKMVEEEIEQVGKSDRKKDKIMEGMTKDKFLSILKGSSTSNVKQTPVESQAKQINRANSDADSDNDFDDDSKSDKKWGALSDNYMMGAKMKDWNRNDSDDDNDDDSDEGAGPVDPDLSDSD